MFPDRHMAVTVLESCTGCGRCVAVCRLHAISLKPEFADGFGRKTAAIDAQSCNGCGDCLRTCPHQALIEDQA